MAMTRGRRRRTEAPAAADIEAWSRYSAGVPLLVTSSLPNLARRWGGRGAVKRPTPPQLLLAGGGVVPGIYDI